MSVTDLLARLREWGVKSGAVECDRESLVVPWFPGEFNRCVLHSALNSQVRLPYDVLPKRWFSFSPVCRTRDTGKLDSGWHLTTFEGAAFGHWHRRANSLERRVFICNTTVDLLSNVMGVRMEDLVVTFFGGGEVLPGVTMRPDDEWRRAWESAGVPPKNLKPVGGMKNFVLFVGPGERCGPKCEVMVRLKGVDGLLELATAIMDEWFMTKSPRLSDWSLEQAHTPVSGVAFGIERLAATVDGLSTLWDTAELYALVEHTMQAARTAAAGSEELQDIRTLVDQVRALWFVLQDVSDDLSSAQYAWLELMSRRARRRLDWLQIDDWRGLVNELEASLRGTVGHRYRGLGENSRRPVRTELDRLTWPEAWNPESYLPGA